MAKKTSLQGNDGEKMLFKYVPVYPQAPTDMNFHYYDGDVLKIRPEISTLIRSIDELKAYAEKCKGKIVGVDTETTGLSYFQDFIVGFSVCCEEHHAIYVPIRHQIRRTDKVRETLRDENGNPLLTKTGRVRTHTVNKYTDFDHEANLDPKEALDVLYDIMLNAKLNVMHNSEFDLTMIRAEGYDVMQCPTFDTTILTYLYDAENKNWNKLKEAAKIVLGRKPMKFYEALGDEENFRYVDLEIGYPYAAIDSLNVRDLYLKLYPEVKKLIAAAPQIINLDGKPYNVIMRDNELIRAFTDYYNHAELLVNNETAKIYKKNVEEQLAKVEKTIYEYFNRGPFNLNSGSKEFKQAMADFEIDTGLKTDTGAISYGKKGIEEMGRQLRALKDIIQNMKYINYDPVNGRLDKRASTAELKLASFIMKYGKKQFKLRETTNLLFIQTIEGIKMDTQMFFEELKLMYKTENKKLEILKCIQVRSSLMKALNSYITKLTEVDRCKMRYRLQGTSSGRLSSGNGSKNDKSKNRYYIDLNAQNFTKPHSAMYNAYRSEDEGNILGWKFDPVTEEFVHEHKDDPEYYFVEGSDPNNNIRACIEAPKGRLIASLDYSAQEYKMIAILSQDRVMLNNFKRGLDPHTSTAYAIWGEENYDRQKRKKAKICVGDGVYLYTDKGLVKSEDLTPDHKLIDENGTARPYARMMDEGDLIEIEWSSGVVERYTPDHPVKVWNGSEFIWKAVKDLTEDDNVVCKVGYHNVKEVKPRWVDTTGKLVHTSSRNQYVFNTNTKEFAYIMGLYLGDGTLTKKTGTDQYATFRVCVEPESTETVCDYLDTIGITKHTTRPIGRNQKINEVYTCNAGFARLVDSLFGRKKEKHVPDWVWTEWNDELILSLLAGMIDSDGTAAVNGYMVFSNTNKALVNGFIKGCLSVGLKTSLKYRSAKYNGKVYPYCDVQVYELPRELPLLNIRKQPNNGGCSRTGVWDISEDYRMSIYKGIRNGEVDRTKDVLRGVSNNLKAGRTKLTKGVVKQLREYFGKFPIEDNMACVKIVRKALVHGHIHIIEVPETHTYCTLGAVNHNCNFLMNYSGGPSTLSQSLDISLDEAKEIIDGYEKGFWECTAWKRRMENIVINKQHGVCYSIFGRPRQFISLLSTASRLQDPKFLKNYEQNFDTWELSKKGSAIEAGVKRRIVSHEIQSPCGDICRWDLIQLYRKYFRNRDPHVDFVTTVHDEINFSIDLPYVVDYVRDIDDIMTVTALSPDLPITTSVDLGYKLGVLYPFEWADKERTTLVPKRA